MTGPDLPRVMADHEADYLLAAGLGLAQGARLIPVAELAAHFEQRFGEARARGTDAERRLALHLLGFADILRAFVGEAEQLMEARRKAEHEQAAAAAPVDPATVPLSQRPLASDDAWVAGPTRAPR